jgi:N-acetylglutamate synthase-like GNAT family acetyltransferase
VIKLLIARDAKLKEVDLVVGLINLGVKEGMLLKRTKKELKSLIKDKKVIVVSEEDVLVGIIILDFYSKRLSELRSIYVAKDYRLKGVGSMLVDALKKKAKDLKVKELMTITTKDMKNWFGKFGFNEETHNFKVALFHKL